jgi:hypothetical protein
MISCSAMMVKYYYFAIDALDLYIDSNRTISLSIGSWSNFFLTYVHTPIGLG